MIPSSGMIAPLINKTYNTLCRSEARTEAMGIVYHIIGQYASASDCSGILFCALQQKRYSGKRGAAHFSSRRPKNTNPNALK
jgi:hypothetical protein